MVKKITLFGLFMLSALLFCSCVKKESQIERGNVSIENKKVKLQTSMGDIIVELNAEKAPLAVKNFLGYVESGFYNGTIFHRVIKGFMIQAGGLDKDMNQKKTNPPIKNEASNGLKNDRGTIAMGQTPGEIGNQLAGDPRSGSGAD